MQQRVKGVISAKMVKIIKFLFFAQKVSSGMGAPRTPPKMRGQGGGFVSFVFNRKRKRKWKNVLYIL